MTRFAKIATAASAAIGLTLLAGFAMGGPGGHCAHRSPEQIQKMSTYMVNGALDELDATDDQRAQVLVLKDDLLTDGLALKAKHGDMRDQVEAQWLSDTPDAELLHELVDSRLAEVTTFAHKAVDSALQLHAILTPEQRAELLEMHEERRGMGH